MQEKKANIKREMEEEKARIKREKAAARERLQQEKEQLQQEKEQKAAQKLREAEAKKSESALEKELRDCVQEIGLTLPVQWRPTIIPGGRGFELEDGQIFLGAEELVSHLYACKCGVFPAHCYKPYVASERAAMHLLKVFHTVTQTPDEAKLEEISREISTTKQAIISWFQVERQRNGACRPLESEERVLVEGSAKGVALRTLKEAPNGMTLPEIAHASCAAGQDDAEKALLSKRLETVLRGHTNTFVSDKDTFFLRVQKACTEQAGKKRAPQVCMHVCVCVCVCVGD
jgi:hypothetical protein